MAERNTSTERRARTQPAARKKPSVKPAATARVATTARSRGAKVAPTLPRLEIRALKQALAKAEAEVASTLRARDRAVNRAEREREALEAQLTKLVQEIGVLRHHAERAQRLETEARQRDSLLAERTRAWTAERAALQAEIASLRAAQEQARSAGCERDAADERPEVFGRRAAAAHQPKPV